MEDLERDLLLVKREIRSVLIASSSAISVQKLLFFYQETVGKELPFRKFGFKTVQDFLTSMPDVVAFTYDSGQVMLMPVEVGQSSHINQLVMSQRGSLRKGKKVEASGGVSKKRRLPFLPTPMGSLWRQSLHHPFTYNVPRFSYPHSGIQSRPKFLQNRSGFMPTWYLTPRNQVCSVGKDDRNINYCMKTPTNRKVSPDKVPTTDSTTCDENGSCKLKKLQNEAASDGCSIGHSLETSANDKIRPNSRTAGDDLSTNCSLEPLADSKVSLDNKSEPRNTTVYVTPEINGGIEVKQQENKGDYKMVSEESNAQSRGISPPILYGHSASINESPSTERSASPSSEEDGSNYINERLKINIRAVLKDHPNGILLSKFPQEYFAKHAVPFNSQDYGYGSLKDFVLGLSNIFTYEKSKLNDWLLFDKETSAKCGGAGTRTEKSLPTKLTNNIVKLVSKFPYGIYGNKILELYSKKFGQTIDLKELGFESVSSFLVFCQGVDCRQSKDNLVVFPKNNKFASNKDLEDKPPAVPPGLELEHVWSKFVSEEVCSAEEAFKPFEVPPGPYEYLKVRVVDLADPYTIWFQLLEQYERILSMMDDLNIFYDSEGHSYSTNNYTISIGLMCSVRFSGDRRWHRATVTGIEGESIEVFYVDYGTKDTVGAEELRFLHKNFAELPIQAIRGRMADLVWPETDSGWSLKTNQRLSELTYNKALVAEILRVHFEEPCLDVVLYDTSDTQDVCVNSTLLNEGFAIKCSAAPPSESDFSDSSSTDEEYVEEAYTTQTESLSDEEEELEEEEVEEEEDIMLLKDEIIKVDGVERPAKVQENESFSTFNGFPAFNVMSENYRQMDSRLEHKNGLDAVFSPQESNCFGSRSRSFTTIATMTSPLQVKQLVDMVDESSQTDLPSPICSNCKNRQPWYPIISHQETYNRRSVSPTFSQHYYNETPDTIHDRYYDNRRALSAHGIGTYQTEVGNCFNHPVHLQPPSFSYPQVYPPGFNGMMGPTPFQDMVTGKLADLSQQFNALVDTLNHSGLMTDRDVFPPPLPACYRGPQGFCQPHAPLQYQAVRSPPRCQLMAPYSMVGRRNRVPPPPGFSLTFRNVESATKFEPSSTIINNCSSDSPSVSNLAEQKADQIEMMPPNFALKRTIPEDSFATNIGFRNTLECNANKISLGKISQATEGEDFLVEEIKTISIVDNVTTVEDESGQCRSVGVVSTQPSPPGTTTSFERNNHRYSEDVLGVEVMGTTLDQMRMEPEVITKNDVCAEPIVDDAVDTHLNRADQESITHSDITSSKMNENNDKIGLKVVNDDLLNHEVHTNIDGYIQDEMQPSDGIDRINDTSRQEVDVIPSQDDHTILGFDKTSVEECKQVKKVHSVEDSDEIKKCFDKEEYVGILTSTSEARLEKETTKEKQIQNDKESGVTMVSSNAATSSISRTSHDLDLTPCRDTGNSPHSSFSYRSSGPRLARERIVKIVILQKYLHVLRKDQSLLVPVEEVMRTFTVYTTMMIIKHRFKNVGIKPPLVDIYLRDYPILHNEFRRTRIFGVKPESQSIALVPIKQIVYFLTTITNCSSDMIAAFKELQNWERQSIHTFIDIGRERNRKYNFNWDF